MTRRRMPLAATAAIVLVSAVLTGMPASAEQTMTLRVQNTVPESLPVVGPAMRELDRSVAALTGGTLRIRAYEPGALVPALQAWDTVAAGALDATNVGLSSYVGKEPALAFFNVVPFGPGPAEYLAWLYAGGGIELMDEILAGHGLKALQCVMLAAEGSGWFRKPIEKLEDLQGLKMRIAGLGGAVLEKLGVATQLLAAGDVHPALERGVIDAAELGSPDQDLHAGMHQLAKHYYLPGWHQPTTLRQLVINLDLWNGLSDRHQAALEVACRDLMLRSIAQHEALQAPALAELERRGVTLHRWSPEFLDAFEQAWHEVVTEYSAKDATFRRVWESYDGFRQQYAPWKQLGHF